MKPITLEKWEPIWLTNAKYYVSNFGRVRSAYTMTKTGKVKIKTTVLKTSINRNGYETVNLQWREHGKRVRKTTKVHRLVCEAFHKNKDNKPTVNHIDLNPLNNHFKNLEWATYKENVNHAQRMGAFPIAKPYVKKGYARCYKPIIDTETGQLYNSDQVAELLGIKRKYVTRMLSGERKPNTSKYKYAG